MAFRVGPPLNRSLLRAVLLLSDRVDLREDRRKYGSPVTLARGISVAVGREGAREAVIDVFSECRGTNGEDHAVHSPHDDEIPRHGDYEHG